MTTTELPPISPIRRLGLANTLTRSIAERLVLSLLMGLGLGAMGVWMGPLYLSMQDSLAELVSQLPGATTQIFGDFGSAAGFINAEIFSIFGPALLIYVALTSATRALAGEEENQTIGLLLANPHSRSRVLNDKGLAMTVHVGVIALLTGLGVGLGSVIADLGLSATNIAAITIHFWLLGVLFGSLAMLLSVLTGRRMMSVVLTAVAALIAYVWGAFLPLSEGLSGLAVLSPWDWYFGSDPLSNGFQWVHILLLITVSACLWVASLVAFRRRDLPG